MTDRLFKEFQKWKTDMENEEKSQYIRNTSKKKVNGVEYLYYVCHRSNHPRLKEQVINTLFLYLL